LLRSVTGILSPANKQVSSYRQHHWQRREGAFPAGWAAARANPKSTGSRRYSPVS